MISSKLSGAIGATVIVDEIERLEAPVELSDGVKTGRFPLWIGAVVSEIAQRSQPRRLEGVPREPAGAMDIPVVVAEPCPGFLDDK